jgi:hypothetical protein
MLVLMGSSSSPAAGVDHLSVDAERHHEEHGLPGSEDAVDEQELDQRQGIAVVLAMTTSLGLISSGGPNVPPEWCTQVL